MAVKRAHIFYSGRVQGVGFRFTAEAVARGLGAVGWVRNLRDGRVEVLIEGEEADLKGFLEKLACEMGDCIRDAQVAWERPSGEFKDFGINLATDR